MNMWTCRTIPVLALCGFFVSYSYSDADGSAAANQPSFAEQWIQRLAVRGGTNGACYIRPGIWAGRKERTVYILAERTALSTNEPVEFILIGPKSGHDYEALAVSKASPQHVREALEFIGVPAGRPIDYSALQLWPRGERISISLQMPASPETEPEAGIWIAAEQFIIQEDTGVPLPEQGFVFSGSVLERKKPEDEPAYSAEISDPYSIVSLYNEPRTMLDVPRQAPQGSVYGTQLLNPQFVQAEGTPVLIRLVPLPPGDGTRSMDLTVRAYASASTNDSMEGFRFDVLNDRREPVLDQKALPSLLALFGTLKQDGRDLYIAVQPDDSISLKKARQLFTFFQQINTADGARLSPAGDGDLYYKAFLPDMRFADRAQRPNQPWELHLAWDSQGGITGQVELIEEPWADEVSQATNSVLSFPVRDPAGLKDILGRYPDHLKVLFIYAPNDMSCGQAKAWYRAVYPEYKTVYFYPEP